MKNQIAYRYDGSFEGFLCCIFDSFYRQESPAAILSEEDPQGLLYPERYVETDSSHAQRVFASLSKRISKRAEQFVSCLLYTSRCSAHHGHYGNWHSDPIYPSGGLPWDGGFACCILCLAGWHCSGLYCPGANCKNNLYKSQSFLAVKGIFQWLSYAADSARHRYIDFICISGYNESYDLPKGQGVR